MARREIEIARDKLRAAIRKLGKEYAFYMLNDAIDLLPPAKLHKIASKYLDVEDLRPDEEKQMKSNVLTEVEAFQTASLAGEYYESFNVDSRSFMEKSGGTTALQSAPGSLCGSCKRWRCRRGAPGLRHHLRAAGPHRSGRRRHHLLRR